jgi:tRNA-dihydrouridine synthase
MKPEINSQSALGLKQTLALPDPLLALAPMQKVTDLAFWKILASYGGPDVYWTEFFRVTPTWKPEKWILQSLVENPTHRPAIAQLIGNEPESLRRAAKILMQYPVAAIDLNLGCPAPVVYKKCAGGGLLRDLNRVDSLLKALREVTQEHGILFSVKTRVGFDSPHAFPELLALFAQHPLDLLTVHGRTVSEMYRPNVHYDLIREAARSLPFPVLANGNVDSAERALQILDYTGASGLMIGRGCIRNPWLFEQIRAARNGIALHRPTGRELLQYIETLWTTTEPEDSKERLQVEHMKRYLNFIGQGIGPDAATAASFLHQIRRTSTRKEFFSVCHAFLDHDQPQDLAAYDLPPVYDKVGTPELCR